MLGRPLPELAAPRGLSRYDVLSPNLGLFLGRAAVTIPDRGLLDCNNVRIKDGKITSEAVGYSLLFAPSIGAAITLIYEFATSLGASTTIFGTKSDLLRYDEVANLPLYITPRYVTGTVAVTNGSASVTGTGTTWSTNLKAGDKIHFGSASQDSVSAVWYTILTVNSNISITLTANFTGATASGVAYTARKLFTAPEMHVWSADVFPDAPLGTTSSLPAGDRFIATNGTEVVAWDGNANTAVVISTASTGLGFSCRSVLYYKNMMLYGGLVEGSTTKPANFKNSAIADPENVTTLEANEYIAAQSVDFLLTLKRLGDYAVAYCSNSVNVIQFVEAPFYFAIRTAAPRIGLLAARLVADYGDYHEFLAKDQAYRFDGLRLIPFGEQVFNELLRLMDRQRLERASVAISEEKQEAYWVLPLVSDATDTGGAKSSWTEHYAEPAKGITPFTKRDMPATAMGRFVKDSVGRFSDYTGFTFQSLVARFSDGVFSSNFPVVLFGDEFGYVHQLDTQTRKDSALTHFAFVTSPVRPIADRDSRGIIRRVEPFLQEAPASGDMTIRVGVQDTMNGPLTTEERTHALDQSGLRYKPFREPGRYGRVTFETQLPAQNWTLEGYRVTVEELGER